MPITMSNCLELNVRYHRWAGVVVQDDFLPGSFFEAMFATEARLQRHLFDWSHLADIPGGFHAIRTALSVRTPSVAQPEAVADVALWCPTDQAYGLGRIFQKLADNTNRVSTHVFREEGQALEALNLPFATVAEMQATKVFLPMDPPLKAASG